MTTSKAFDITYPDAAAGTDMTTTGSPLRTAEQMVEDMGGSTGPMRVVRPIRMDYDYIAKARG